MRQFLAVLVISAAPFAALAGTATPLAVTTVTEWKAVYGQIETKDRIPARARIGGTLVDLSVTEGDMVTAGQKIATIVDDKIAFQLDAYDAQLKALQAQLQNAQTELTRGQDLMSRGVSTNQQVDALRTQVEVLTNQIAAATAQRRVVEEQAAEGAVLAPLSGKVLAVPVTKGAVVMAGEPVATVGGGGFFLRLAVPERFANRLKQGATIDVEAAGGRVEGRLAKIYPLINAGRVIADVEVNDLPEAFVDARVLVRLPVGTRPALMVPATALQTRAGLDYVTVEVAGKPELRTVVPGEHQTIGGADMVEILSGLQAGDAVVTQ